MSRQKLAVPSNAVAITLYRVVRGELIGCEPVLFSAGATAVDMILRRAAIHGRVEIGAELGNYFADLLDRDQSMIENVALDAGSYRALKTKYLRTVVQQ